MRRIVVANQKGGVGKSTLVINLAWALAGMKKTVLVVDCDPQGNSTTGLLGMDHEMELSLYHVFSGDCQTSEAVAPIKEGLDLIPSDIALASADLEFGHEFGRENKVKKAVTNLQYDFVIFDTPPSLGLMSINALMAAEQVIIPVSPSFWALRGIELLEDTIEKIREGMEHEQLHLLGAVAQMVDKVTVVSRDALAILRDHFGKLVFKTTIPKRTILEEANAHSQSIFEFAPESDVAVAYQKLAKEVLNRG